MTIVTVATIIVVNDFFFHLEIIGHLLIVLEVNKKYNREKKRNIYICFFFSIIM